MQKNDGDQSLDRVLERALPELMTSDGRGSCVDAETVAAWTEGALPASEAALVETHLSRCARCQQLVATLVRTAPPVAVPAGMPAEPLWRRWRLQWLVPIAASAAAVALWVAVPADRPPAVLQPSQQPSTAALKSSEPPAPAARPDSDAADALGQQVGRLSAEPDRSTPESSELQAGAGADGAATAARRADATSLDQAAASNEPLAETAALASSPPAAAPVERRELSVQREADASIQIVSPNPANRWRIVAGARVERSTTAGSTWEAATVSAPAELTAGASPNPLVCWLVGRAGAVRLTTDGTRFDRLPFPEMVDLVGVRATSETSATVTAADGRVFRTDDRGSTWRVGP